MKATLPSPFPLKQPTPLSEGPRVRPVKGERFVEGWGGRREGRPWKMLEGGTREGRGWKNGGKRGGDRETLIMD